MSYTYIWEFDVRPGHEGEFERHYGPTGTWVELFRGSAGYLDTILLRDRERPARYVTIDRWDSERAYQDFRSARAHEFAALDARCEALTDAEREIGRFEGVLP